MCIWANTQRAKPKKRFCFILSLLWAKLHNLHSYHSICLDTHTHTHLSIFFRKHCIHVRQCDALHKLVARLSLFIKRFFRKEKRSPIGSLYRSTLVRANGKVYTTIKVNYISKVPVPFLIWHIEGMSTVYIFKGCEIIPSCTCEAFCATSLSIYATTSGLYGLHLPDSLNHSHTTTPLAAERSFADVEVAIVVISSFDFCQNASSRLQNFIFLFLFLTQKCLFQKRNWLPVQHYYFWLLIKIKINRKSIPAAYKHILVAKAMAPSLLLWINEWVYYSNHGGHMVMVKC